MITQFNRGLYDYIVATDEEAAPSAAPVELQQRRKRKGAAERWGRSGGAGGEPGTRGCRRGLGVLLETQGCCCGAVGATNWGPVGATGVLWVPLRAHGCH